MHKKTLLVGGGGTFLSAALVSALSDVEIIQSVDFTDDKIKGFSERPNFAEITDYILPPPQKTSPPKHHNKAMQSGNIKQRRKMQKLSRKNNRNNGK